MKKMLIIVGGIVGGIFVLGLFIVLGSHHSHIYPSPTNYTGVGPDPAKVFTDPKVISLANATSNGNIDAVKNLLATGVDVKAEGTYGLTVTYNALYAKQNGPQVLQLLLDAGADPISTLTDGENKGEDVPSDAASRDKADPNFMTVLLDHGVSPSMVSGIVHTSLLDHAVSGNNIDMVKLLLARGANVNFNEPFTGTALHTAMTIANYKIATLLVQSGIDLNLKDSQDPDIDSSIPKYTAAQVYCKFQSGKRPSASTEQLADFQALVQAYAKRGVVFPCGI